MSIKHIVYDYSNDGLLFIGTDPIVSNLLKSGLVDCDVRLLGPKSLFYDDVKNSLLVIKNKHFYFDKNHQLQALPSTAWNTAYMNRRRLVKLRYPLFKQLSWSAKVASKSCDASIWPGMENNLQFALRDCDPLQDRWSDSLIEYGHIVGIEPAAAYRELCLQRDGIHSIKMRVYGFVRYFSDLINTVQDESAAVDLKRAIDEKFFKDTFI
jgi:hypothetical protein